MSIKKYRLYLLLIALVTVIVGALALLYLSEQENSYVDGTLVRNEYVTDREDFA